VTAGVLRVTLAEWEERTPADCPALAGRDLGDDPAARALAEQLTASGRLEIQEMRHGLHLRATSFVGRIRLGDLEITILPKIAGAPFLDLVRYGFRLRDLHLHRHAAYATAPLAWPDLLVAQLVAEAEEILARGPHRAYLRRAEDLASPRGRIDIDGIARRGLPTAAVLPCIHHVRHEDTLPNRVLLAGLRLGARLTADRELALLARRLAAQLAEIVQPIPLDASAFAALTRARSRLTGAYEPALELVRLLAESHGLALEPDREDATPLRLQGLLFDMNRLFQLVLTRLLAENLPDHEVEGESRLGSVFRFVPGKNPRGRPAPAPRPDIVVLRGRRPAAILDAKYRDLAVHSLPRDMLYQLAIYALGTGLARATLLYATVSRDAREEEIEVLDPTSPAARRALVVVRPCSLEDLAAAARAPRGASSALAHRLVSGPQLEGKTAWPITSSSSAEA